jgi:type VI secretion system protein ImpA
MINVDELLQPVTSDKPCGEDFSYHPSLQNLESLARGKAETQFSPAEEPQWKEVRDAALEVLGQSKHLTAGVILTVSLLELGGLEGFRDGLAVLHGLTERFWPDLYPKLDPEDNNDPTERLNILNNLASGGEPYRCLVHVKQIVVCQSPSLGRITLQQILDAQAKAGGEKAGTSDAGGAGGTSVDLNQIQATFRDAGAESSQQTLALVNEAITHAGGLASFLETTIGAGRGVNLDALDKLLLEIKKAVEPYAVTEASGAEAGASAEAAPGGVAPASPRGGPGMSGTIQSRADVIRALDLICSYYSAQEPSSPVPLILQRAQRLVDKDFMTIMNDLTPEALTQLQLITGTKPKE